MIIEDFEKRIDAFVTSLSENYVVKRTGQKVIHDAVWGSNLYFPWEISLLDSPLLQRLRDIKQTGFAFHTYPTAGHSRYEHTLGVIALVGKIANSLNSKAKKCIIGKTELCALRLSGLLHDVGHSFFSHLTEFFYSRLPEFVVLEKEINKNYERTPKGHEILSFLIVRSKAFAALWNKIIEAYSDVKELRKIVLAEVAGYIISYAQAPEKQFMADIINGPYDVDKLDYLARDAKFCGFSIGYDFERYLTTIIIGNDKKSNKRKLFIPISGINALEQIIINKLMLYGYIYHHQKVRICEMMFRYVIHLIHQDCKNSRTAANVISLLHPCDFLNYTDSDFWNKNTLEQLKPDKARGILTKLVYRDIPKRVLRISWLFIKDFDPDYESGVVKARRHPKKERVSNGLKAFLEIKDNWSMLRELAQEILNEVPDERRRNLTPEDIWIDIPRDPPIKEAKETMIPLDKGGSHYHPLEDFFPIGEWVQGYRNSKWKAHIYTWDIYRKAVKPAAKSVLKRKFDIELSHLADF